MIWFPYEPVGGRVPDSHGAILGARDEDRQTRVEDDRTDVVGVAIQSLHARLSLVVPDLDRLVISARE